MNLPWNPDQHQLIYWLSQALLQTLWQATLLALFLAVFLRFTRWSADARFRIAFGTLLLMALLPLYQVLNWTNDADSSSPDVHPSQQLLMLTFPLDDRGQNDAHRLVDATVGTANGDTSVRSLLANAKPSANSSPVELDTPIGFRWESNLRWTAAVVYLAGVVVMIVRFLLSLVTVGRLNRKSRSTLNRAPLPSSLQTLVDQVAANMGIAFKVPVILYRGSGAAIVVGIWRPTILLNVSLATGLTPDQLEQVLRHEMAHIVRWDAVTQLVQRLVECLLFFHPAAWWVSRQVSELREQCCDAIAARESAALDYAATLLDSLEIAHGRKPQPSLTTLALLPVRSSELTRRIEFLLQVDRPVVLPVSRTRSLLMGTTMICLSTIVLFIVLWPTLPTREVSPAPRVQQRQVIDEAWTSPNLASIARSDLAMNGQLLKTNPTIPANVSFDDSLAGYSPEFTQFLYGDSSSRCITLLTFKTRRGTSRVFCDSDRDGQVEPEEELSPHPELADVWLGNLDVEVRIDNRIIHSTRPVAIVKRRRPGQWKIATLGHVAGTVKLAGKSISYRRLDLNGNGIANDPDDLIQLDLNQDSHWDEIGEQFPVRNLVRLDDTFVSVSSDVLGHQLNLGEVTDTGQLKFEFDLHSPTAKLIRLEGTLRDSAGHFFPVQFNQPSLELPTGRYYLQSLVVDAEENGNTYRLTMGLPDEIAFEEQSIRLPAIEIRANAVTSVPLLKKLFVSATETWHREGQVVVRPRVTSAHGLVVRDLFNSEQEGQPRRQPDGSSQFGRLQIGPTTDSETGRPRVCSAGFT